jgi:hypothetical protein
MVASMAILLVTRPKQSRDGLVPVPLATLVCTRHTCLAHLRAGWQPCLVFLVFTVSPFAPVLSSRRLARRVARGGVHADADGLQAS